MPKPLVLAHRGASAIAPENTLASFLSARDLGADGVELDVTLTREGVPVVIHDDTVDRTTDGHGAVRALTILEVKQLDAGSWKAPQFRGERIPTLAEVFDALADWLEPGAAPRGASRGLVNVELKSAGLASDGVERQVVNLIVRRNLEDRVLISSFNPLALLRVKSLNPSLNRGLLCSPDQPVYLRRAWLRLLVAPLALHPEHTMVTDRLAQWARRKRYPVNTWTVDQGEEARRLQQLGAHALITNRVTEIGAALAPDPR